MKNALLKVISIFYALIIFFISSQTIFPQTAIEAWKSAKYAAMQEEDFGLALFCLDETIKLDSRIEQDYKSVAELYPGFFFLRGWLKFGLKNYTGCLTDMNKCLEVNYHDSVNVFLYKAKAKASLEDTYGALLEINKAIYISPKAGPLYHLRGAFKLQLGDKTGACLDWSKSGELGYLEAYDSIKQFCQ